MSCINLIEIYDLKKQLAEMKKLCSKQQQKINILEEEKENMKKSLNHIFTKGQLEKIFNKNKKLQRWTFEDISAAICLHFSGPRAYRYMYNKLKYPLPSISSLKRWSSKLCVKPGVLKAVLKLMEKKDFDEKQRLCILSFDEISVKSVYEYDKLNDVVINPHKSVQVVMARGLIHKWKQPIFYKYDCPMTVSILKEIVIELHKIGYTVTAIVSDMGVSNVKLWSELEIGVMKTWFPNFADSSKKIFVFADAPHLLKLIRNHFIDTGFIINEKLIDTKPLREMLPLINKSEIKISKGKFSTTHLDVQGPSRQKVKLAAQLFSHTVSACLNRCYTIGLLSTSNTSECANFIKILNDWFDILNSKIPIKDSRSTMKAYGLALAEQNKILLETDYLITNLRGLGKRAMYPFQRGILVTNSSLRGLYNYLKDNYNITYLLTNRLNQDVLENFFSIIRASGGMHEHPSPLQFKYRLRSYLLGKYKLLYCTCINFSCLVFVPFDLILSRSILVV